MDVKLGLLDSNNIKNSDAKYKVLEELNINQNFQVEKEKFCVRDYLLDIEVDGKKIFITTE